MNANIPDEAVGSVADGPFREAQRQTAELRAVAEIGPALTPQVDELDEMEAILESHIDALCESFVSWVRSSRQSPASRKRLDGPRVDLLYCLRYGEDVAARTSHASVASDFRESFPLEDLVESWRKQFDNSSLKYGVAWHRPSDMNLKMVYTDVKTLNIILDVLPPMNFN